MSIKKKGSGCFSRRAPEERRSSILAAARDILQARNFHDIKMENIAVQAGVAKGTLYLYFPTKEKLFQSLAKEMGQKIFQEWQSIWEKTSPGEERLKALIFSQLKFFDENKGLFLQVFQGNLPANAMGGLKKKSELIRAVIDMMAKAIEEGVHLQLFRPCESLHTAVALFGLIRGFVFARILCDIPYQLTDQTDFIWDVFLNGAKK